jgi:hypothetical protein
MLELAITQAADFLAFARNAKTISMPDGSTVWGPLKVLPHQHGDYVIRAVVVEGPQPGPAEIGGTEPPVIDGDVVKILRTVQACPPEMEAGLLAQAGEAKKKAVDAERDRRRHPGNVDTGLGWDVDLRDGRDESNIAGKVVRALTIKAAGGTERIGFMGADNVLHDLTADEMIALGQACDDVISDVYGASWIIKGEIDAAVLANSRVALDAIDEKIHAAWPQPNT